MVLRVRACTFLWRPLVAFLSPNTNFLEGNMITIRKIILGPPSAALLVAGFGSVAPAMAMISRNHTDG